MHALHGAELYGQVPALHGFKTLVKIAVDEIPEHFNNGERWALPDKGGQCHPHMASRSWKHDLSRLALQKQHPEYAVDLVRRCTETKASSRPSISEVRESPLFSSRDWAALGLVDI